MNTDKIEEKKAESVSEAGLSSCLGFICVHLCSSVANFSFPFGRPSGIIIHSDLSRLPPSCLTCPPSV
jgi:hypothetical protein